MDRSDRHNDSAELLVDDTERRNAADDGSPRVQDLGNAPGGDASPPDPYAGAGDGQAGAAAGAPADSAPARDVDRELEVDELDSVPDDVIEAIEEDDDDSLPPALSRKVRRRARRTRPRSKTIAMKRLTREELRIGAMLNPPVEVPRPVTRAECQQEARPCPWVACKHHLYLDVNPETGSIKVNFPDLEPWELGETCALDIAERGGITLEEVGEIMNLTRERIRQVEVRGLAKLKVLSPSPDDLGGNIEPGDR